MIESSNKSMERTAARHGASAERWKFARLGLRLGSLSGGCRSSLRWAATHRAMKTLIAYALVVIGIRVLVDLLMGAPVGIPVV
jgi:hypothetical protein